MEHGLTQINTDEEKRPYQPELLMPAGSLQKLKTAVLYGADAVYLGTPDMSLRTQSEFTLEDVMEGVAYAHEHGKRVYLTLNLFSHNKDIEKLPTFLETIRRIQPDGVIIADPGIFQYVHQQAPELSLHISTQANVSSWLSVQFWQSMGASLVVLAREVTFAEMQEIREKCPDIKLEAFIHGSMCMTYSGRCLLSNYLTERGANQGNCAHSCRWHYKVKLRLKDGTSQEIELTEQNKDLFNFLLEEDYRPGELMEIEEDAHGSYILNAKDLCLMPKLDAYLQLGVDSLKVEGRNKSSYYAAVVARAYRMAIDDWLADPESWSYEHYMDELMRVPNRGFTLAFHDGRLQHIAHNYEDAHSLSTEEFAGWVTAVLPQTIEVEIKNRLLAGDVLEFVCPGYRDTIRIRLYQFTLADGTICDAVHPGQGHRIHIPFHKFDREDPTSLPHRLPVNTVVRKTRLLREDEQRRLKLDKTSQQVEAGKSSHIAYEKARQQLAVAIQVAPPSKRAPRQGIYGCCGKGCNGCLIFAHDPAFKQARSAMKGKKIGERLPNTYRQVRS